ncbi:hypothetical protein [Streptomyces sp. NPDC003077]|uniref:hypothetical protein n=1 Tax=Streptomyces sp. NPDC003077 TaxID=3154443 RepID=UPI0033B76748
MNTRARIALYAAALAATFGVAYGVGRAAGPASDDAPAERRDDHERERRERE